ncbi:endonuclease/exonuclease/phosphatase family protein [Nonomuraea angiospora]
MHALSKPTRLILTVLAMVAAMVAVPVTAQSQTSAEAAVATRPLKFMNYNLCGASCNAGEFGVVDVVFRKIQEQQPDVVTLQESCRPQVERLQELLNNAGYGMRSHFSPRFFPEDGCGNSSLLNVGNAVFVRGDIRDTDDYSLAFGRTIGCVTVDFGLETRVCTIHGSPTDSDAAEEVKRIATTMFPASIRRMPLIIAGDFNISPTVPAENPAMKLMYAPEAGGTGDYWEVDQIPDDCPDCPPRMGGAPTHHEDKIDYIFVSAAHFDRQVTGRVESEGDCQVANDPKPANECSDHEILWGEADLRLNEPVRALQFNMCGFGGVPEHACATSMRDDAASATASSLLDFRPDVVTLNEVCREQYDELLSITSANGYTLHGQFTAAPDPQSTCDSSEPGNALISSTPLSNVETTPLPGDDSPSEQNNLTCADTTMRGQVVKACVTQLSDVTQARPAQAEAVAQRVNAHIDAGFPVIVGGDFQSNPDGAVLTPLYSHHGGTGKLHELDETDIQYFDSDAGDCPPVDRRCRSGEGTVPNLVLPLKLDYLFVSDDFAALDADATRSSVSSHVPLRGWATLTSGDGVPVYSGPLPPTGQNLPPTVSAGPDLSGSEGQRLRLQGSASDAEGGLTVTWTYEAGEGVDAGTTCSFGNANTASTTITCTDDGTFLVTLTANDGVNAPVSDTARIRLRNEPPLARITGPAPWSVYRAGTPVELAASFADAGSNDSHTCKVAWDDGTSDSYVPAQESCDRTHTFAKAGMYTIKLTVTDDDGGVGAAEVMVVVYDTDAGFITAGASFASPAGALAADPDSAGRGSFQFNPMYKPGDDGPVPGGGKVRFDLAGIDFNLDATELEWLVVTQDGKAATKGKGTVSGRPGYGFVLYGYDDPDKLRLVVWPLSAGPIPGETLTYDNRRTAGYDVDVAEPQGLASGSVQIHS